MAKCSYCRKSIGVIHGTQPRTCKNSACQKISCDKCAKTMLGFSAGTCPHCGHDCHWLGRKPEAEQTTGGGGSGGGGNAGGGVALIIMILIGVYWDEITSFFEMVFIISGLIVAGLAAIWVIRQLAPRFGLLNTLFGIAGIGGAVAGGLYFYQSYYLAWARAADNPMHMVSVMDEMDDDEVVAIPESLRGVWSLEARDSAGEVNGRRTEVTVTSSAIDGMGTDAPIHNVQGGGSGERFAFRGVVSGYDGPLPCAGVLENPSPGLVILIAGCRGEDGEAEWYAGTLRRDGQVPSQERLGEAELNDAGDIPAEWHGAWIHHGEYRQLQVIVSGQGIFGWDSTDPYPLIEVRGESTDSVYAFEATPQGSYGGGTCRGSLEKAGDDLVLMSTCTIDEEEYAATMKLSGQQVFGEAPTGISLTSFVLNRIVDGEMVVTVGTGSTRATATATIQVGLAATEAGAMTEVLGEAVVPFVSGSEATQALTLKVIPSQLAGKHLVAVIQSCASDSACQQRLPMASGDVGFMAEPAYKKRGRRGQLTFTLENRGPGVATGCSASLSVYGTAFKACAKKRGGKDCLGPEWQLEGEWLAGETRKLVFKYTRKEHGGSFAEASLSCGGADLAPQDNMLEFRLER